MKPKTTKRKATPVFLTKREAVALFDALEILFSEYPGGPECPKCAKHLFSAIEKVNVAFSLGVGE